jgi:putative DNA primase/helicase
MSFDPHSCARIDAASSSLQISTPEVPAAPVAQRLPSVRISSETRGVAGLHHVQLRRDRQDFVQTFYLDDAEAANRFINEATDRLLLPDEDHKDLRRQIKECVRSERLEYERCCDHLLLETMDTARKYPVEWLWPGRIAANKLTMLVGDPGIGKTFVALDIAARVSTGRPWPDESPTTYPRTPGNVLILSELDDFDDTLRPRLEALDADMRRIVLLREFVRTATGHNEVVSFSVGGNLQMLQQAVDRVRDCRLVIIDPLSAYVDSQCTRRDLNAVLQNLVKLAVDNDLAVLVVSHSNRGPSLFHSGSHANSRFCASARLVWKIVSDADNRNRRLMVPVKNNLVSDWLGLGFCIETAADAPASRVVWEDTPFEINVEQVTHEPTKLVALSSRSRQRESACEWLRTQLIEGRRLAQEVLAAAREEQIGEKLLRRALRELGGLTHRGPTGRYVWFLPDSQRSHSPPENKLILNSLEMQNCAANQDIQAKQGKQANLSVLSSSAVDCTSLENNRQLP